MIAAFVNLIKRGSLHSAGPFHMTLHHTIQEANGHDIQVARSMKWLPVILLRKANFSFFCRLKNTQVALASFDIPTHC